MSRTSGRSRRADTPQPSQRKRRSTKARQPFSTDVNETQAVIPKRDSGSPQRSRRGPQLIGPYKVLEEISRGGMGIVYKALDPNLQRQVAIKVLLAGEGATDEDIKRFQREGQASARLQHANIVQIHAVGEYEEKPYFVMDFVEGQTVKQLLEAGRISPRLAMAITEGAAEGLDHAARQGVIHRDVKPANIIVDNHGMARIMDFGLAKRVDEDLQITQSGTTMGTPSYMSPEQAEGHLEEVDAQSDVYSLGAVLYEMLTGQPPFDGQTTLAVLHKVLDDDPVPPRKLNPRIHIDIQTICLKCLEKEKRRRYLNGRELAEDVRRFNAGEPISATPIGFVGSWVRRARKHLNVTLSVLVGLGIGLAALGYNLVSASMSERRDEAKRYKEARSYLRKANKLLHEALDARANLPKHDARKFDTQMEEIRECVKEAEDLFRKAQFNDPDNREAKERLAEVELYDQKLEVERFVFMARNFLEPRPKEGANMASPPNYPAARAFAEEALARDADHKEAIAIRRKAIGIRAVTIRTVGGNAQVFARRIADSRGNPIPESGGSSSKGNALGWTPINNHEMFPGLYVLTFYAKSRGAQEATLRVSREGDKDPVLTIEIGAKEENMVLIPTGTVNTELSGPQKVDAFYIDRFEYPNQAGIPPRTEVNSLAEAMSLCKKAGKKLCTAQQWLRACIGDKNNKFPYGRTYQAGWCATGFELGERDKPFPSGWFPRCRTARGVFDMSGNVSEWTDDKGSEEVIHSGDWLDNVRAPDLFIACRAAQLPGVVVNTRLGVRCCKLAK